jgi:hypothetical protein
VIRNELSLCDNFLHFVWALQEMLVDLDQNEILDFENQKKSACHVKCEIRRLLKTDRFLSASTIEVKCILCDTSTNENPWENQYICSLLEFSMVIESQMN